MKFELLPNEILLDYFPYFNAFDGLNYNLNRLIRNIPLDPEMKSQIYSLHLSDAETDFQIDAFLSFFHLMSSPIFDH